jgi:hypothetical protein
MADFSDPVEAQVEPELMVARRALAVSQEQWGRRDPLGRLSAL